MFFFFGYTCVFFLLRSRVFSLSLSRGARRRLACTPPRKCEPRPGSVAAFIVAKPGKKSRGGVPPNDSYCSQPGPWKPRADTFSFFLFFTTLLPLAAFSHVPQPPGHAATVQQQRFKLFSLWQPRACVCVCIPYQYTAVGTERSGACSPSFFSPS